MNQCQQSNATGIQHKISTNYCQQGKFHAKSLNSPDGYDLDRQMKYRKKLKATRQCQSHGGGMCGE